ncbi:MAG: hypothetical protein WC570_00265 [Patescibacteria group bacterium]
MEEIENKNSLEIVKPLLSKLSEDYQKVLDDNFVGFYVFGFGWKMFVP